MPGLSRQEEEETFLAEGWEVKGGSRHRLLLVLAAVALVFGISVASLVVVYPYLEEQYFGPAPVWHPFGSVFTNSGQVAAEECSVENLQPVLQGVGGVGKITSASVVACSFHGSTYEGRYGTDCNLTPTGTIPSINGTLVPYDGCVLSRAPLNSTFVDIFALGPGTNRTIPVYSNRATIANMTPIQAWKSDGCSLAFDNFTMTDGVLSCKYLGVLYVAGSVLQRCNLGTPIDVYGEQVPAGSCNLDRSDQVSN